MPSGVYDRALFPRSREYQRNTTPEYLAWKTQRLQQNRTARAIRDDAMRRRNELLVAMNQKESL